MGWWDDDDDYDWIQDEEDSLELDDQEADEDECLCGNDDCVVCGGLMAEDVEFQG